MINNNYIEKFFDKSFRNINSKKIFYKNDKEKYSYLDLGKFYKKFCNLIFRLSKKRIKIAIISSKNFESYSCIISIILSKNIWIPINPHTPNERIKKILLEANPDILIVESKNEKKFQSLKKFCNNKRIIVIDFFKIKNEKIKRYLPKSHNINSENISMIFFTSGSTGKPKGVKLNYRGFLHSMYEQYRILFKNKKNLIFGDYHDPSFVISLNILLLSFFTKNTICPATNPYDSIIPIDHIKQNKVNVLITVPSTILRVMNYTKLLDLKNKFKIIIMCGEPFHLKIYKFILKNFNSEKVYNCYGSTELSPWVFYHKCKKKDLLNYKKYNLMPIGKPFKYTNTSINKNELLISGKMLSDGYLDEKQNKEKFFNFNNVKWYKTGDIVKKINNIFLVKGRLDRIVKINGYRVDLTEIEKYIQDYSDMITNVVSFTYNKNLEKKICCVVESKEKIINEKIIIFLKNFLPSYMLPKKFIFEKKFKINKNGKVDRAYLIKKYSNNHS